MREDTQSKSDTPRSGLTVLQVVPELETGGAERTTLDIARALTAEGHTALVASRGGRLQEALRAAGGVLIRMPAASKNPVQILANAFHMKRACEAWGVDIIHARSRAPAWSALIAAKMVDRPFLTTYHGTYNARLSIKRAYNSVMVRGRYVIANSAFIAGHIQAEHGVPEEKIVTIPRGVDLATFDPESIDPGRIDALKKAWGTASGNALTILLPARLTKWKGQLVFVKALAALKERTDRAWRAVLAGDAQGRDRYHQDLVGEIEQAGLSDHIILPGHCADIQAAYLASDIVVAPSLEPEAFGRTAAEAQAMARPIIASDHGGARETVIDIGADPDRGTGWRVAPGDVEALATALADAIAMPRDRRETMTARGRALVEEKFSLETMARDTLSLYKRIVAES